MGLLDVLTGGLGSGIVGAIGGVATAVIQMKAKKDERSHELAMAPLRYGHELALRQKDLEQVQAEAAAKVQVVQEEGEAAAAVEQLRTVTASYAHDAALHASGSWVMRNIIDPFAASVRPGLSVWAAVIVGYVTVLVMPTVRAQIALDAGFARSLTETILGMANMIFAWWFAARLTSGRGKK
jgi:ABC-type multidrug transport system fused ATPase/permease subunit